MININLNSPSRTLFQNNGLIPFALILAGLGLFALNVFRAVTYPFTHDEALSYLIFNGQPYWADSANNHLLNTALMKAAAALLGDSEIVLRLPNILAHGVYLTFSILLSLKLSKPAAQVGSFIILNTNLFMLDFFFLARGYGLGLGFQMASLTLLVAVMQERRRKRFLTFLYAAVLTAVLAVFANFTFLNFFIPLWIISLGLLILNRQGNLQENWGMLPHLTLIFVGGVACIAMAAHFLFQLKANNELYLGGTNNILLDTLKSLVQASLYTDAIPNMWIKIVAASIMALIGLFLLAAIALWVSRRRIYSFHCLLLILIGAVLLPILQNRLFDTPYPVDRSALLYVPLVGILLGKLFDFLIIFSDKPRLQGAGTFFSLAISLILAGYFALNFNAFSCYSWAYEAKNKEVLQILNNHHKSLLPDHPISVGISWVFEPSLNYYRISRHYNWLQPFTREPIEADKNDFIYAFEKDLPPGLESYQRLAEYPSVGTILLEIIED